MYKNMYCTKCGERILDGHRFCYRCGSMVRADEPAEPVNIVESAEPAEPVGTDDGDSFPIPGAQLLDTPSNLSEFEESVSSLMDFGKAVDDQDDKLSDINFAETDPSEYAEPFISPHTQPELNTPPVPQKEQYFFGKGALLFCLTLIAILSASTGVFAGLFLGKII